MDLKFIDLQAQYTDLKSRIDSNIEKVLTHGQYIMGPEVALLEKSLAEFTGSKYCITVGSGTDALLISLMALGVQPGDEVITTPFSFISTVEVIVLLGAIPVFVDVEPETCNINANLIEDKITPKTKAIIPVSLYGQTSDMDTINSVASLNGNIPVIEDAAQSFGALYKGRKSCNLSKIGCTSFFPSKPLGCYGDGGAIFTSDETIANICKEIRVHGQSKRYVHSRIGVGGRMDTLQCAIVLSKLERFEWELEQRKKIGNKYNKFFDEINLERVQQRDHCESVFGQYTLILENRERVQKHLNEKGIPTAVHYPIPINEQSAYKQFCCCDCTPVSSSLSKKVMSLPMGPYLKTADQQRVMAELKRLFI